MEMKEKLKIIIMDTKTKVNKILNPTISIITNNNNTETTITIEEDIINTIIIITVMEM